MFGKVVYLDNKKLDEYMAIATGKNVTKIDKIKITSDKDAGIDLKVASLGGKATKSYEVSVISSQLHDIAEFEKAVKNLEAFFDFQSRSELELDTILRGSVIRFDTYIQVPEKFDFVDMLKQFKALVSSEIPLNLDEGNAEVVQELFEAHKSKLPIISELSESTLCSLIEAEHLRVTYNELEEYETTEVTILARVVSDRMTSKSNAIFDPLRDFISLNRKMRREISSKRPAELELIYCDDDYKKIDIIAIYQ